MSGYDYLSELPRWERYHAEDRIFGIHNLFWKIWRKRDKIRELTCPRCGKKGRLMQKTTVSKKKYKYRKWYVYHERKPIPNRSLRFQKWCYLNRTQMQNISIQRKTEALEHLDFVDFGLLKCIRIRYKEFAL